MNEEKTLEVIFRLEQFCGPLELLFALVHKEEIDICTIFLQELVQQFLQGEEKGIDKSAEFLSLMATLLLIKSRSLLPQTEITEEEREAPPLELMQHLLEYYRVKEAAEQLSAREEEQKSFYPRGWTPVEIPPTSGLENLELQELTQILRTLLTRASQAPKHRILEEKWKVSDQLLWLKETLLQKNQAPFEEIFNLNKYREELIATFLALLELMKMQFLYIKKEETRLFLCLAK